MEHTITSAVHCQPLPGLQILANACFSGPLLCFGFSLHQTRAAVFTIESTLYRWSNWLLSWSESRHTMQKNTWLSSPVLLLIIRGNLPLPFVINRYLFPKIHITALALLPRRKGYIDCCMFLSSIVFIFFCCLPQTFIWPGLGWLCLSWGLWTAIWTEEKYFLMQIWISFIPSHFAPFIE